MFNAAPFLPPGVARAIRLESFRAWRGLRRYGFGHDDLHQEMFLHWFRQRGRYDAHLSSPPTFAAHVCRHRTLQLVGAAAAQKRGGNTTVLSLSDPVNMGEDGAVELVETISEDNYRLQTGGQSRISTELGELRMDVASVLASLPSNLANLARHLASGSVSSAAKSAGISRSTAYRHIRALQTAFSAAGLDGYVVRRQPSGKTNREGQR